MGEAPSPKKLEQVRSKGYPTPLQELLIRLLELSAQADFLHREAAALVEPGGVPKLHVETGEGEWVVSSRLVSAQLNPRRDSPRPPSPELVEAFVRLYEQRGGPDPKAVRKQINTLYAAADRACREHKRLAAVPAPSRADLAALEQTIASLREEITARTAELAQLRAESERTHRADQDRVEALDAELTQLRAYLEEVSAERDELRSRTEELSEELGHSRDKLIRATAESDQQQARITELEGAEPDLEVRQDPRADSVDPVESPSSPGIEAVIDMGVRICTLPAALMLVWLTVITAPLLALPFHTDGDVTVGWLWVAVVLVVYWLPLGYVVYRQYFPDPGLRVVRTRPRARAIATVAGCAAAAALSAVVGLQYSLAGAVYVGVLVLPILCLLFVGAGGKLGTPASKMRQVGGGLSVILALSPLLLDNVIFGAALIVAAISTNLALMVLLARLLEVMPENSAHAYIYAHMGTVLGSETEAYRLRRKGRSFAAINLLEKVATATERVHGRDHRRTLSAYSSLAFGYEQLYWYRAAITLNERLLRDHVRIYGTVSPDTNFARSRLAYTYLCAKQARRAVELFELALHGNERKLGAGARSTLSSRSSLALAYERVGRASEARSLLEMNLAECERSIGADDPLTKTVRTDLEFLTQRLQRGSGEEGSSTDPP
ncbi:tetratricopeptide repeat protein [Nocardia sp. NPDC050408]|uniref:tetratricopeptide repeat protein n=1 Tax=Nocardia sp. NPDC050408 TaxID=3364319 RepID=UPI0037BC42CD